MIGTVQEGRYRVLGKLGEGGTGEVYLVEHLHLGRREALKVLLPAFAVDPTFVSRFRREARATNRVQHPNIVSVYDFGRLADGRFFLAMEYVQGERIDQLLRHLRRFPVDRALHILHQLADAVAHAHARAVIHRDLKPSNLMLVEHRGRQDVLKVLDFGLAKILAPEYQETLVATRKGEVLGTPTYLAPDQLMGMPADPRADVYSIGCIAYELLTGEPPFRGRAAELVAAHLNQVPEPPGHRRPELNIPSELDAVVMRCLEKTRDDRYQNGGELRDALTPLWRRYGPPPQRRTRQGLPPLRDLDGNANRDALPTPVEGVSEHDVTSPGGAAPSAEQAREAYWMTLHNLAERLIDSAGDPQLIVAVARLREADSNLARVESEVAALEARMAQIEQAAREQEASLGFAVGELRFERATADADRRAEVDRRVRELEARIGEIAGARERELAEATDRGIALAVARDDAERGLAAAFADIEVAVGDQVARGIADEAVAALAGRLRALRDMLPG